MANGLTTSQTARAGVELCRQERWEEGLELLALVFNNSGERLSGELPGLLLSYLGYGIARFHDRKKEGLQLCEQAVKLEFYQVDAQFNLARTALLVGERKRAVQALDRALKLDPTHAPSLALRVEMGRRRSPLFSFLARDHALNRLFGRLLHGVKASSKPKT